jgi:hypothetical protein
MPKGADAAVARLLERWDANVIIWYLGTVDFGPTPQVHPFAAWLLGRPDWRPVFVDEPQPGRPNAPAWTTVIFLREHPRNAEWLARLPAVDRVRSLVRSTPR